MYSTCIFCHAPLGANESIEHFPIGRRVAFDSTTGRLWAICHACERWNLSPIEERWEALDDCEVAFRSTKLRFSTDQIGLARMRDGTEVIRIGQPLRPEMAAWRYGDQFGRRRRRHALAVGTVALAAGGLYAAGLMMGVMGLVSANLAFAVANHASRTRLRFRMRIGGTLVALSTRMLGHVELRPNAEGGHELRIPITAQGTRGIRWLTLQGHDASSAAAVLLPNVNARGASERTRRAALDLLERFSVADEAFRSMAIAHRRRLDWLAGDLDAGSILSDPWFRIGRLRAAQRLCLEMIVHEEDERRALEGDLDELEARWKEAEEIGRISDSLLSDCKRPTFPC